jgi:hypothetical protein
MAHSPAMVSRSAHNGTSSNQYVRRGATSPRTALNPASPGLVAQAAEPPARYRCGEVWAGRCKVPVGPPDYSHGQHPSPANRAWAALLPGCPPRSWTG